LEDTDEKLGFVIGNQSLGETNPCPTFLHREMGFDVLAFESGLFGAAAAWRAQLLDYLVAAGKDNAPGEFICCRFKGFGDRYLWCSRKA